MEKGYIAVWRKIFKTSFYKDSYALHLAVHLMLKASHKEHKIIFNNQELLIKQGDLITGRVKLSAETGIKSATIYKKLKLLENIGFCNIKSNNKFSVISICKYKDFQIEKTKKEQQEEQQRNNSVTTKEQQRNTYNNDNKGNKGNKEDIISAVGVKEKTVTANDAFFATLKENPAYAHVNFEKEWGAMNAWFLLHPKRQKTKRFIINWLNRVEVPIVLPKPVKPTLSAEAIANPSDDPLSPNYVYDDTKYWEYARKEFNES